ncbi:hypothetical protein BGW41_006482 [Actinomortierella wolfii]|nr:hypothetical protein BGW41_006482 [Actinomortierella wolfii]
MDVLLAYDNPAALNTQLQKHLEMPYDEYQYLLSALYSIYSLPNTVLPFVFGHLVDRFGPHRVLLFLRSVVNTLVTPWVEQKWNVSAAVWVGTLSCVLSFASALALITLMAKVEQQEYRPLSTVLSNSSDMTDSLEADASTTVSEDEADLNCVPPMVSPRSPHPSIHSVIFTPGHSKLRRAPSLHVITDQKFLETPPVTAVPTWQESWWSGIRSFPMTFWLVCILVVLLYGTVVPFNNIASDFLQSKWFPGQPRKATAVMGIPDTIGSVLVPVFGLLVDKHGGRASILIMSALIMVTVHTILGFTMLSPIFAFSLLGIAYSMYGVALWPSIACVVKDEVHLGMGYGISTSFLNISLTLVPPIVATIRIVGDSFVPVEMFFICMGLTGIVVGLLLRTIDAQQGGALEAPEIEVEVPIIVPPPGASSAIIASADAVVVSPILSSKFKFPPKSLGRSSLEHMPSPLGLYQDSWDSDGIVDTENQDYTHDTQGRISLGEPILSPNQSSGNSSSRDKRPYTLPWNHNRRGRKLSPSRFHGSRRVVPYRSRPSIPRSMSAHPNSSQQPHQEQQLPMPKFNSSSSSPQIRSYGTFSSPSTASFGLGIGIMVDEEATLHETPLPSLRPLPPRHQYSVRQHPILHNPLRGSSGSFRIHRNTRPIGFGEGEEGDLFLNGTLIAHPENLQSTLFDQVVDDTPTSVLVHDAEGGQTVVSPTDEGPEGRTSNSLAREVQ